VSGGGGGGGGGGGVGGGGGGQHSCSVHASDLHMNGLKSEGHFSWTTGLSLQNCLGWQQSSVKHVNPGQAMSLKSDFFTVDSSHKIPLS